VAAKDLGIHPLELRRRNGWKDGSITVTGQELRSDRYGLGFIETLDRLNNRYASAENRHTDTGPIRRCNSTGAAEFDALKGGGVS
jgi:CO/xanthine dehydrogenase Mo-binding subunit